MMSMINIAYITNYITYLYNLVFNCSWYERRQTLGTVLGFLYFISSFLLHPQHHELDHPFIICLRRTVHHVVLFALNANFLIGAPVLQALSIVSQAWSTIKIPLGILTKFHIVWI
jgi:hypothetical protein